MNSFEQDLAKFEAELKAFDWFYVYSDDYSAWKRGEAKMKEIRLMKDEFSAKWGSEEFQNRFNFHKEQSNVLY